ncbi:PD-(D/E)XK nuclease family protein [Bacillus massiliigorillae]|uniref:PD-(D/E)XK nuclease family protein n=1 Tax=Bacillus massiliigorillae TaxID=1243664 RepID=UPI0018A81EE4|nr:PD-(D/E)XK nuclease family protein [Bacillus massiliigorillae]
MNLKIQTVRDCALQFVRSHDEYVTSDIGTHLLFSIMKSLKVNHQLQYFNQLEMTPSLCFEMYEIIQELRLAGFSSKSMDASFFVSSKKGHDLMLILTQYEEMLRDHKLKDDSNLYEEASLNISATSCIYILQSNLTLRFAQEMFLKKVLNDQYDVLPLAPVYGITLPRRSKLTINATGEATPLSYLYMQAGENEQSLHNVSLLTTKTIEAELKEVLLRIKNTKLSFDDSVILFSNSSYVTTMYHLAVEHDIPITFNEGIAIGLTRPGKLLKSILHWISNNYLVSSFSQLLQEGILNVKEGSLTRTKWISILRNSNIGWGKERYISQLEKALQELNVKREINDENQSYYEERFQDVLWLKDWYQSIFVHLPEQELVEKILYRELLKGIYHMIKNFGVVKDSYDKAAQESILERMEHILPYANEEMSIGEGILHIEEQLLTIQVGASKPKSGCLHCSSYNAGLYVNRKKTFIVGLDNQHFPARSSENPLLLDIERKKLGQLIPLKQDDVQLNLYKMLQILASTEGTITLSYCQFDINENRTVGPAHLLLQVYRMQSGKSDANFKDFEQAIPVINEQIIMEQKDWWLGKLVSSNRYELDVRFLESLASIKQGIEADELRYSRQFTVYDGKIESDTSLYDPRVNQEKTITAGKLENLATCPYSFFLQNILRIKPIEDMEYTPNRWLDPATRGSLLHAIFERFYREITSLNEKPNMLMHQELIEKIVSELLEQIKVNLPSPNNRMEYQEVAEILESCYLFLKIEEENSGSGDAKYFEYSFGIKEIEPATIALRTGNFHLSGQIDRVDLLTNGNYHIIDYKTGSTWGYDKKGPFKGGRQLQHFLYTLAIENHLSLPEGSVEKSTYLFPSKKGLGQAFTREQETTTRTNGKDIIEKLLTIIEKGHFTMTDDDSDCKYCDFKEVCRRDTYDKDIIDIKHQDQTATGVRSFKGVRAYD